jgi:hypothetical protein
MGQADFLSLGDWNAACSMCGHKFKASELRRHWQGMYRCKKCWEPRHPQDFVKSVKDDMSVPWSQPRTDDDVEICSLNGQTSFADMAIADCSTPDRTVPVDFTVSY